MNGFWDIVLTVLGWLSLPLFGLSVWLLFRSVKRDMRVRVLTLVIPLATTILVPVVYVALLGVDGPRVLSAFLLLLGLGVGLAWADTTDLTLREGTVMGKRSPWYLVVWGVSFGLTQLLALVASPGLVALGVSTMYLSMGVSIGTNGSLLFRRARVGAGAADPKLVAPLVARLGRKPVSARP